LLLLITLGTFVVINLKMVIETRKNSVRLKKIFNLIKISLKITRGPLEFTVEQKIE